MTKRKALGKGLSALIPDADRLGVEEGNFFQCPIEVIEPNPLQPRQEFEGLELEELVESVKEKGIITPLLVSKTPEGYRLIAGERRWRAAQKAGLERVPVVVRETTPLESLELALVENIQREDLDAIEIAISYQRLIEECNLTQEKLRERVGKQRSTVANYLRLLKLPAEIQLGIKNKQMTMGHARTLINIEDEAQQIKVYYRIIDDGLSVRKAEELVRKLQMNRLKDPEKDIKKKQLNEDYRNLSGHLSEMFKSEVQFRINEKGKGKIVIPFDNTEQMERILEVLDKLNS